MTPLFVVCCTVQHKVVYILFFICITYHIIHLFVCLFLSFSCSVFVLVLVNMFDDGLLSYISSSPKFYFLFVELSLFLVRLSKYLDPIFS